MDPPLHKGVEHGLRTEPVRQDDGIRSHDLHEQGEGICPFLVALGEYPHRALLRIHHYDSPVGSLADEGPGCVDVVLGSQRDRRVDHKVRVLHGRHHVGHSLQLDILGKDSQPATTRHRLGHPAARYRCHVRHHDRDVHPHSVGRGQIHIHTRGNIGEGGREEDLGIGQLVCGWLAVDEPHDVSPRRMRARPVSHKPSAAGTGVRFALSNRSGWSRNAARLQ